MKTFLSLTMLLGSLFVAGYSIAAQTDPAQARKELTSMGLSYADKGQFVQTVERGDKVAFRLFLSAQGFDINAQDIKVQNLSIFEFLYSKRLVEMLSALMSAGYSPSQTDLGTVVKQRDLTYLRSLVSEKSFNRAIISPLVIADAIDTGDSNILSFLLTELGPSAKNVVNTPGQFGGYQRARTAPDGYTRLLNYAIDTTVKNIDPIKMLIAAGADVNAIDARMCYWIPPFPFDPSGKKLQRCPETPLLTASAILRFKVAEELLKTGANVNSVVIQDGGLTSAHNKHTALSYLESSPQSKSKGNKGTYEATLKVLTDAGAKKPEQLDPDSAKNASIR